MYPQRRGTSATRPAADTLQPTTMTGRLPPVSGPPFTAAARGIRYSGQEPDACPHRRSVQDVADEQRHDGAAYAPTVAKPSARAVAAARGGQAPQRAGHPGESRGRPGMHSGTRRGGVPQHHRGDHGRHDEHAAVDEERRPQGPGGEEAADRGAADPAHQEPARVQAAGPAPLVQLLSLI